MRNKTLISVLNRSDKSVVKDHVLDDFVHQALQPQVADDFFPAWRVDAQVMFVDKPIRNSWWLVILDKTDQKEWLGYHLTSEGMPLGKVFAKTIHEAGYNWTVTASHELLEMLADPEDNRMISYGAFVPGNLPHAGKKSARFYAMEVCDPCSSEECAYQKGGYSVSDFILPSWYEKEAPAGQLFDCNRKIQRPFDLFNTGYAGVYNSADGWQLLGQEGVYRDANGWKPLGRKKLPTFRRTLIDADLIGSRTQARTKWERVDPGMM